LSEQEYGAQLLIEGEDRSELATWHPTLHTIQATS
jgi:hypothetical protein